MGSILHKDIRNVNERCKDHILEALKDNAQSDGYWGLAEGFMQIINAHRFSKMLSRTGE